jgi:predicted Ser/Thr protein kinase
MSEERRCTHCGAALTADVPQGLCPACLLQRGLDSQTESHDGGSQPSATNYMAPTPAELAPHFPDLEILELLGQGGMGVVYKARQKNLNRLVALKILGGKVGPGPAFADRFAREARALAMLNHPHIVTVYDFGQTGGLYYFLMEFVEGVNLRQLLDSGRLAPKEALAIVPQICEALQYAHDKGIVHRDIKPANILLDKSGRVKIADFGVAKLMGQKPEDGLLTGEGHVMGTPHYMAPEQVEHPLDVDHRADIYSLGVVFYQMLTGELPIGRFAAPSKKVAIDVRLDEVVLRALEKEPELRFQQASEVKTRVETIAGSPAPALLGAGVELGFFDLWPWDNRCLASTAGLYCVVLTAFVAWWISQWSAGASLLDSLRIGNLIGVIFAICGLSYLAGRAWVGQRVRCLRAEAPKSDVEVAEALIDRDFRQGSVLGRGFSQHGIAVLHADRLELIHITGGRIILPLADIVAAHEIRWFMGRWLFWKQGLSLELKDGRCVGVAIPRPFARRWRVLLGHASQLHRSEVDMWTAKSSD